LPIPFGYRFEVEFSRILVESTEHDHLAQHLLLGAGHAVEVLHTFGESFIVHEDARSDGVGPDLQTPGLQCKWKKMIGGVEE
jgi:hypothetical protein